MSDPSQINAASQPDTQPGKALCKLAPGDWAMIGTIEDITSASLTTRLGLVEGSIIECVAVIPAGPVVIRRGGMELAIGRELSNHVRVIPCDAPPQPPSQ